MVAYQLARYSYSFQSCLCEIIRDDPNFATYDLFEQFERLIMDPLLEVKESLPSGLVIVLDSLDECQNTEGVQTILGAILRYASDISAICRFLVTSDPGLVTTLPTLMPRVLRLHCLDQSSAEQDIATYFALELETLAVTDDQTELLTERAKDSFIYAVICARFIWSCCLNVGMSKFKLPPILEAILRQPREKQGLLDGLYTTILTSILEDSNVDWETANIRLVLQAILFVKHPMSVDSLAGILRLNGRNEVLPLLGSLLPILHVSESGDNVFIFHRSFRAFATHPQRSGMFYCDNRQGNHDLACLCLDLLQDKLRFNICERELSWVLDRDIDGLSDRAQQNISPELIYACRYLGDHAESAASSDILVSKLNEFLSNHLLSWMEVLNLRQCIHEGVSVLSRIEKWLLVSKSFSLS